MSATNVMEDKVLSLIMTNVAATQIGDAGGLLPSATAGSYFVGLYTGNAIGDATSDQTSNETGYQNYARVGVARSTAQWTVLNGNCDNDNVILFAASGVTGTPSTITDFGLGFAASGVGQLQLYGQVNTPLIVNNGVQPQFAAGALDISLD